MTKEINEEITRSCFNNIPSFLPDDTLTHIRLVGFHNEPTIRIVIEFEFDNKLTCFLVEESGKLNYDIDLMKNIVSTGIRTPLTLGNLRKIHMEVLREKGSYQIETKMSSGEARVPVLLLSKDGSIVFQFN